MANEMKSAQGTVLTVVIIGIVLVIGIFILAQMSTTFDTDNTAVTVTGTTGHINETGFTLPPNAGQTLNANNFAVVTAMNTTSGLVITSPNFTVNSATGLVTNATAVRWNAVTFNWTYTYSAATNASSAADSSVEALSDGTPWLTILIVVAFAVIVLGMLTSGFNGSRNNDVIY